MESRRSEAESRKGCGDRERMDHVFRQGKEIIAQEDHGRAKVMADIEKVIKGLEMCLADEYCDGCPYEEDCFDPDIDNPWGSGVMRDALELLKEQPHIVYCEDCRKLGTDVCPVFSPKNDWFCAEGELKQQK